MVPQGLLQTERSREGGMEVGVEGDQVVYLSLHCHHQNDSRVKMGRDESFH